MQLYKLKVFQWKSQYQSLILEIIFSSFINILTIGFKFEETWIWDFLPPKIWFLSVFWICRFKCSSLLQSPLGIISKWCFVVLESVAAALEYVSIQRFKRFPFAEHNLKFSFLQPVLLAVQSVWCKIKGSSLSVVVKYYFITTSLQHEAALSRNRWWNFPVSITPDFYWEEETFIKCEQTNLILVVSKLENLLTKAIFQFYSLPLSTLSALSCISIIVLSLLLCKNLIYYFFSSGIIFLFSPVINLCQAVTVVTKCKYHW